MDTPKTFPLGTKVKATAFVDCFGNHIPEVRDLTVTEIRLISCNHIPDYYLVTTVYPSGWTAVIASARFFEVQR